MRLSELNDLLFTAIHLLQASVALRLHLILLLTLCRVGRPFDLRIDLRSALDGPQHLAGLTQA